MHYVVHDPLEVDDPNYEFPLHDGDTNMVTTTPTKNEVKTLIINDNETTALEMIDQETIDVVNAYQPSENLARINTVESSVNEIKNEMRSLVAAIGPLIQAASATH